MPRCPQCANNVPSVELGPMPMSINVIGCRACRGAGEDEMAERKLNEKKLGSIELFEVSRPDGSIDHRLDITGNMKGMDIKFGLTMDKVRDFFSRGVPARNQLKAVKD